MAEELNLEQELDEVLAPEDEEAEEVLEEEECECAGKTCRCRANLKNRILLITGVALGLAIVAALAVLLAKRDD